MTPTDYIINGILVLLVVRQIRERRLDLRSLLLPVVLVAYAAHAYLHSIPTGGNDLVLITALTLTGATLGTLAGLATHIRPGEDGVALAHVGWVGAMLWVLGIGSRMVFAFSASHGAGHAIAQFSAAHQITGGAAWTAAFVLMAFAEVLARLATVYLRGHRVSQGAAVAIAA